MAHGKSVSIDTVPLPERPIRVTIPAKVAFDLEKFQNVIAHLAERLGCPKCFSGRECLFELERDLVIDPADLRVHGLAGR